MTTVDAGLERTNCDGQITGIDSSRWILNPEPLTLREYDVLCGLVTRKSYGEIAKDLGVSLNTVKFHAKNIYSKWGVAGRRYLIAFWTYHAFAGKTGYLVASEKVDQSTYSRCLWQFLTLYFRNWGRQ